MNAAARKRYILDTLVRQGAVNVRQVAQQFKVADMTVRRDLAELEERGYLVRNYGGAVKADAVQNLFSFTRRVDVQRQKKESLSQKAAELVADGDTLFLDAGTTVYRLCRHLLARKNLRVITHSLPVVSELMPHNHIKVYMIGGEVLPERKAVYGPLAEEGFKKYRARKAFIGVDGFSQQNGLSAYDEKEARNTLCMIERADQVYLLCDSTKLEQDSAHTFAPYTVIDTLITDRGITAAQRSAYQKSKIKLLIA